MNAGIVILAMLALFGFAAVLFMALSYALYSIQREATAIVGYVIAELPKTIMENKTFERSNDVVRIRIPLATLALKFEYEQLVSAQIYSLTTHINWKINIAHSYICIVGRERIHIRVPHGQLEHLISILKNDIKTGN